MRTSFKIFGKMHVLHICTALSWRGGEQQLAYLAEELEEKDVLQTILCSKGSEMENYCIEKSLNYYSVKKGSSINFFYAKTIAKLCKKLKVDLCHLHDAHAHSYAIIAATFFNNPSPLILSRRVDFPIKKNWASNFKYNHPSIKKILCVSDTILKITSAGIRDTRKLVTVHSGIDLQKFSHSGQLRKELGIDSGTALIGNTSALADQKDYFTFIETAGKVIEKQKNTKFLIFGKGPLQKEIVDHIQEKKLGRYILLMGFRKDIPKILGDLDVFFISSKTEGLGTSVLDAFAAGVVVVATAAGGIPELVEDRVTGLLCSVKDSTCLSNAIVKLINEVSLKEQLIANAKQKVKNFSKSATAEKTLKIYREVLGIKLLG